MDVAAADPSPVSSLNPSLHESIHLSVYIFNAHSNLQLEARSVSSVEFSRLFRGLRSAGCFLADQRHANDSVTSLARAMSN